MQNSLTDVIPSRALNPRSLSMKRALGKAASRDTQKRDVISSLWSRKTKPPKECFGMFDALLRYFFLYEININLVVDDNWNVIGIHAHAKFASLMLFYF